MKNLFEEIIGQEAHKLALGNMIEANIKSETPIPPLLITGEKGAGKTKLARSIIRAIQSAHKSETVILPAGDDSLDTLPTPKSIRGEGGDQSKWRSFLNDMTVMLSGNHYGILVFDEFHELPKGPNIMPATYNAAHGLLMKVALYSMESRCGSIQIEDNFFTWNPSRHFIICATNYADKVNPALFSRFRQVPLAAFTPDELQAILMSKLVQHGLRANDDTIRPIVNLCRSSARPLDSILSELASVIGAQGKKTINKADVLTAMRGLQKYPFGFVKDFVTLLAELDTNTYNDTTIKAIRPSLDNLAEEMAYAHSKKLVYRASKGWTLSDKGKAALKDWKADGFQW